MTDIAPAVVQPTSHLACAAPGCTNVPQVQWRRRPTDAEFADVLAAEQARRAEILALSDPDQPTPLFGPLPTQGDTVRAVYACGGHAIAATAGVLVHQPTCTAPDPAVLPACNCTPEPPPAPPASPSTGTVTLSTGWVVPAPTP